MSRVAGPTLHWFRGIPTHDATNAFKLYDSRILKHMTIESTAGFELSLEITVKAFLAGYRIVEVPTTWRGRTQGESRFKIWAWLPQYLQWYFYAFGVQPGGDLLFRPFQQPLQPCHYVCVESWALAPEGTRTSSEPRSPSV